MSIKSRLSLAVKALTSPNQLDSNSERNILTVLNNFGFGDRSIKSTIDEGYASNTYVYSIINRIAESAADIPIIIERKKGDKVELVTEGDFYNFVHRPNNEDNWKSWIYKAIVYQLASGNEFQYGVQGEFNQMISERWMLAPQYFDIKSENRATGPVATSYKYNYAGTEYPYTTDEILHIKKFNPDPGSINPVMGLSPLQAAWRTLVASNETITADASLIKNKGVFGLLSAKGQRPVTPEEAEILDQAIKKKLGGAQKFGSYPITSGDFELIQMAMSPQDLQILENGVMKLRDLCSIYGVSSRMFNDPSGTTFNNSKEDGKKYYTQGVLPPLENEIDQFNRFYTPGWNERDNTTYTVRLDISSVESLQEDQAKEMVKSRTRSTIIQTILKGIGVDWDAESAKIQLMDALPDMKEDQADKLIGTKPIQDAQIEEQNQD